MYEKIEDGKSNYNNPNQPKHKVETLTRIAQLEQRNKAIKQNAIDDEHRFQTKEKEFLEWASNLEEIFTIQNKQEQIQNICSIICHELHELHAYHQKAYAWRVLPEKYKNPEKSEAIKNGLEQKYGDSLLVNTRRDSPFFESSIPIGKSITEMTADELRAVTADLVQKNEQYSKLKSEFKRRTQEAIDECRKKHVTLDEDTINKIKDDSDVIRTEGPEPRKSKLQESWLRIEALAGQVAKKVYAYPPPLEKDEEWAKAVDALGDVFQPWTDKKFRKDMQGWLKVQLDNIDFGKHAAGCINYTVSSRGEVRKLTREQVGDKYEEIILFALKLYHSAIAFPEMTQWYETQFEPWDADRSVRMFSKLSDKA